MGRARTVVTRLAVGLSLTAGALVAAVVVPAPAGAAAPATVLSPASIVVHHLGWHGSIHQPVSVVNHGIAPVRIGALRSSDPRVTLGHDCDGVKLASGRECTTSFHFDDDGAQSAYDITVTGAGGSLRAFIAVDPPAVAQTSPVFPPTPDDTDGGTRTVVVANDSDQIVEFGTAATTSPSAVAFTAARCLGHRIGPGAACTVTVAYRPHGGLDDSGTLLLPVVGGPAVRVTARGTVVPRVLVDSTLAWFGTVALDTTAVRTVTYRNTGNVPSTFGATQLTGAGPFHVRSDGCAGTVLAPGASCAITLTFRPTANTRDFNGDLLATADGRRVDTQLGGSVRAPVLVVTRRLDFGSVPVGTASAGQDIVVDNVGPAPVVLHPTLTPVAGWTYTDGCDGVSVPVGGSCRIGVVFSPSHAGRAVAIPFLVVGGQGVSVELDGRGADPGPGARLVASPADLDVGAVEPGVTSPSQTVTLTNVGDAPTTVQGSAAPTGEVRRTADGCTGTTLAPGASCAVAYALTVTDPDNTLPRRITPRWNGISFPTAVSWTPLPSLQLEQWDPQFGVVALDHAARATVRVLNVGSVPRTLSGTLPFDSPAPHRVVSDGCAGHTLAPGAGCAVTVEVTPRLESDGAASIDGTYNGQFLQVFATVSVLPWLSVDSGSSVLPRDPAAAPVAGSVVVRNTGDKARTVNGHCTIGRGFTTDDCHGVTLAPGAVTSVAVRRSPFTADVVTGRLTVTASGARETVDVTAQGVPAFTVATQSLQLGPEPVGATHPDEDVWILNTSRAAATATVSVTGALGPDVTVTDGCRGASIAPGAACPLHVRFRPTTIEHNSLTLRVRVADVVTPLTVVTWAT